MKYIFILKVRNNWAVKILHVRQLMLFYVIAGNVVVCDQLKSEFKCECSSCNLTDYKIGILAVFASSAKTCLVKDILYFTRENTRVECKEGTLWVFIVVTTSV